MKVWTLDPDPILSALSSSIVNRRLLKIEMQNEKFDTDFVEDIRKQTIHKLNLNEDEVDYFVVNDQTSNYTYKTGSDKIGILYKDGQVVEPLEPSDNFFIVIVGAKPRLGVLPEMKH